MGVRHGGYPSAPLFLPDLWQILFDPPRAARKFGPPWVDGSVGAASAAVEVPPASSADIAGNAAAGIPETSPLVPVTMLGCKERDFPCRTWVEGSPLGGPPGAAGCNTGKSQA